MSGIILELISVIKGLLTLFVNKDVHVNKGILKASLQVCVLYLRNIYNNLLRLATTEC